MPKNFVNVLLHVRLGLLSAYFLHDVVEQTPAVMESADCRALVEVNMLKVGYWFGLFLIIC